jgi:Protein of unknown function (DUF3892)
MIKIIGIKFKDGKEHEHIIEYKWASTISKEYGASSRLTMIDFINKNPKTVFVEDNNGTVEVFVVNANPPYLRTKADNRYTDNLLYLPEY